MFKVANTVESSF